MRRAGDVCFSEVFRDGGGELFSYVHFEFKLFSSFFVINLMTQVA